MPVTSIWHQCLFRRRCYTAVALFKATGAPLVVQIGVAAVVGMLLGFGVGLLTLRMRGIFFSIATIALAIIIETFVMNWRFVGGAAGIQLQRPPVMAPFDSYVKTLFFVQAVLVVIAVAVARYIQNSRIGRGLQALRDDELAAECTGVPTSKLKLVACMISGALMSAAGAPAAMYLQYADPSSAFNLSYSVSALAMSLIGGTAHWIGPVLGAILLGSTQQLLAVTISSEVNVGRARHHAGAVRGRRPQGHHWAVAAALPSARGRQAMTNAPAPDAPLLQVEAITKTFGGFTALDNISVDIRKGERFGLIGPNGSGKTDAHQLYVSGALRPQAGSVVFCGENITELPPHLRARRGIARSFQISRPFKSMTVLENLLVGLDFAKVDSSQPEEEVAMSILTRMGLASKADAPTDTLSQVELRKMELARAMAVRPKLLISDEAMAGLSSSEVDEVLDLLISLGEEHITIIMIEHIMQAVMRFSERVMCLDAGKIIAIGAPAEVMANKRVQEAYLGT